MVRFKIHLRLATLLLGAAIVTGSGLVVAAPSQAAVYGTSELKSNESQMCLQPVNGSLGAAIVQENCNGSAAQFWTQETDPYATHYDWYVNSSSGLCLDVRGGDTNGTPIEQWTCDQITNEAWLTNVGSGTELVSDVSPYNRDKAISTPGLAAGDAMVLYSNTGTPLSESFSLTG
jgi:Ricin-type beta-trefoil lectin domain